MIFTQSELDYLKSQHLGRIATAKPDGTLQVSPVGFRVDPATGTIDITGFNLESSRKYRNVADNGRVAFVVDDLASVKPWRVRCIEIRGRAETIAGNESGSPGAHAAPGASGAVIRIHPGRIISFGIGAGADVDPHDLEPNIRNVP